MNFCNCESTNQYRAFLARIHPLSRQGGNSTSQVRKDPVRDFFWSAGNDQRDQLSSTASGCKPSSQNTRLFLLRKCCRRSILSKPRQDFAGGTCHVDRDHCKNGEKAIERQ